jgi:hypothetical protein
MKKILFIILTILSLTVIGQNFTYSGYIYNANGIGAVNVPVKVYQRVTPILVGFTSQTNYNSHSYYRSTGSMLWTDAKQACISMGGHLVTLSNISEQTFVFNTWPSGWIGFTDESVEGSFVWVTGEPVTYTNWNPGEPNNAGNEDYAQFVGGGKWNDLPNMSLPYVIEFDYIVTTGPWGLYTTVYTDATGKYTINTPSNPSIERYIQIDAPTTITSLQNTDAINASTKVMTRTFTSLDYYKYDVNNDGIITVSDEYYIFMKKSNRFLTWGPTLPNTRIFTPSQFTAISTSTVDLRLTYPGTQTITINSPISGGSSNYYLINTGYSNTTTLGY